MSVVRITRCAPADDDEEHRDRTNENIDNPDTNNLIVELFVIVSFEHTINQPCGRRTSACSQL